MGGATVSVAAFAVLWVPGAILRRILRRPAVDRIATLGEEIALGLAFWPLLFLLTSSLGMAWTAMAARVVLALMLIVLTAIAWKRRAPIRGVDRPEAFAIALVAIVVFTRVRQIAGVAYPLWVDSVHHAMIVRLLTSEGRLPASYAPFIPDSTFYYHWGFHAVMAFVAWVTGSLSGDAIARLLLFVGQLLNVLVFFAVYCGANVLLRSRRAAVLAATLATLVSFFPAYYVSWGRYTQLCGLLVLPPLAAAFWRLGRHPGRSRAAEVAVLSGGLLLIHVRVAIVFAVLAVVLVLLLTIQRQWRGLAWCGVAAAAGTALAAPWLIRLESLPQIRTILAPGVADLARWETPNQVPDDLLWSPNNAPLFALATGGLIGLTPARHLAVGWRVASIVAWAGLVFLLERRARRKRRTARRADAWRLGILALWVLLTAALINIDRIGLPRFRPVPNSAAIIMLFLPLSAAGAHLLRWTYGELLTPRKARALLLWTALAIGIGGASTMLRIINPTTLLVLPADRDALRWIPAHTPPTARFAVGVQPWIGGSFMGIDGGYWIPVVAGRASILPPGLYPWVMPADRVAAVTNVLEQWHQAQQNGASAIGNLLRADGLTHVYFGPRNDTALRRAAAVDQSLERVYDSAGVEIYKLR